MIKKIKICICGEFPPPYGGIGLQSKLLADSLKEIDNCQIQCISTYLTENETKARINNIRIFRSIIRTIYYIRKCMQKFPDSKIIHIMSGSYLNFFLFTASAVFIGRLLNKRIIIHYHGGAAEEFLNQWGLFAKPVIKMVDKIIAPSDFIKSIFSRHGFSVNIVPNIVSLESFVFIERNNIAPKILITRHLEPIYNISCAIRGFVILKKEYPKATLTIAGDGSEREDLEKLAKELGCGQEVKFIGKVNSDKINRLYNENDILLNTSNVDNLPLSILEGFACGLLIVSTKAGGIPFVVKHKENGLLARMNDDIDVANQIKWAIKNQVEIQKIIKNAHNVVDTYTWRMIKPLILKAYLDL